MDMLSLLTLAVMSPATGDRFPVLPLIIIVGVFIAAAIVTSVIAKKKQDDE